MAMAAGRRNGQKGRTPLVSPELVALVAKHAPKELHLLEPPPHPLPRRGPRLTDLLADSGASASPLAPFSDRILESIRPQMHSQVRLHPHEGIGDQ